MQHSPIGSRHWQQQPQMARTPTFCGHKIKMCFMSKQFEQRT
jgi:hypothetical protein